LDVCEKAQVKYGQDGAAVGWNKIQQLNNITVNASQHVRVLRVHLSLDLSLDKHVSSVDADSVATLVVWMPS